MSHMLTESVRYVYEEAQEEPARRLSQSQGFQWPRQGRKPVLRKKQVASPSELSLAERLEHFRAAAQLNRHNQREGAQKTQKAHE